MKIKVLYFASLAEKLDTHEEILELSADVLTVANLKQILSERGAIWQEQLNHAHTRCSVNHTLSASYTTIPNEAEVAFFPPVTGG